MSLEQTAQPAKRKYIRARPAAVYAADHPDQVLSFLEWCSLNRISERNGRRIVASGTGPEVIQLSRKRTGITVGANRAWQQSRLQKRRA